MKPIDYVNFRGVEFPLFDITIKNDTGENEDVRVGTVALDILLTDAINSGDDEARVIDEGIFFYIDDDVTELSEEEIVKFAEESVW